MGSTGKLIAGVLTVVLAMSYSNIVKSTMGTVSRSVATIELSRIDKCLREHHTAKMADAGAYGEGMFYPKGQEEFEALMKESFDSAGRDSRKDQWGNNFRYQRFEDGYRVVSLGPDGKMGNEDDLWLERHGRRVAMNKGLEEVEEDMAAQSDQVAKAQEALAQATQDAAAPADALTQESAAPTLKTPAPPSEFKTPLPQPEPEPAPSQTPPETKLATPQPEAKPTPQQPADIAPVATPTLPTPKILAPPKAEPPQGSPPAAEAKPVPMVRPVDVPTEQPTAAKPKVKKPRPTTVESSSLWKLTHRQKKRAKSLLCAAKNMALNKRYDKARNYYKRVTQEFPQTEYAQTAADALAKLPK